jgi:hypothetical protein
MELIGAALRDMPAKRRAIRAEDRVAALEHRPNG